MKFNRRTLVAAVLGLGLLSLTPEVTFGQGRGNDRGRGDERGRGDDRGRGPDNGPDYHFRPEDRGRFSDHYKKDVRNWERHPDRRHHIGRGDRLPDDYRRVMKAVPSSYYRNLPPPPPGYQFGYYDGYVVAYNPTTRIIADVLDLVNAATR